MVSRAVDVMIGTESAMGFLGGSLSYGFLKRYWPGGEGVPMSQGDPYAESGRSKLKTQFGPGIFEELRGKVVLDFGCGSGRNAIELAQNGCTRVIGLDIQERHLEAARRAAEAAGVADRCRFSSSWTERADVILSTDAFEHFDDPGEILRIMRGLVKDEGYLLIQFGCTWYHPYGGHLFSVFPWAHLLFTERALIRWRSDFKSDGATRFCETAGGLNQISIHRWERLVAEGDFQFKTYELVPIRPARRFHCHLTRELLTSTVRARLVPRAAAR
jgi:SAM-dependent methyltransferase